MTGIPLCSSFWSYKAVFVGKVLAIHPYVFDLGRRQDVGQFEPGLIAEFEVSETFRGVTAKTVTVATGVGDPATTQSLPATAGSHVEVFEDPTDLPNIGLQLFGGAIPVGAEFYSTGSCGHDANCIYEYYGAELSQNNAGPCEIGAGGVFGNSYADPNYTVTPFGYSILDLLPLTENLFQMLEANFFRSDLSVTCLSRQDR